MHTNRKGAQCDDRTSKAWKKKKDHKDNTRHCHGALHICHACSSAFFCDGKCFKGGAWILSESYLHKLRAVSTQGDFDSNSFCGSYQHLLWNYIYFPLEGYLYPETYNFYKETNIEQVIRKVLNVTKERLEPLKSKIESSKYNIHELLTIASIAEKEANTNSDRAMVTQVIYKRLGLNMALGMDVTSYYGVQKEMTEAITQLDLNDKNPYNTRVTTFIGLPVGPICNPSIGSINAALEPADTDYLYFVADILTGKVYFAKTNEEFNALVKKYVK